MGRYPLWRRLCSHENAGEDRKPHRQKKPFRRVCHDGTGHPGHPCPSAGFRGLGGGQTPRAEADGSRHPDCMAAGDGGSGAVAAALQCLSCQDCAGTARRVRDRTRGCGGAFPVHHLFPLVRTPGHRPGGTERIRFHLCGESGGKTPFRASNCRRSQCLFSVLSRVSALFFTGRHDIADGHV